MNGKISKKLRKLSVEIAEERFSNIENTKSKSDDGIIMWDRTCPKGIYKDLKKLYKPGMKIK